MSFCLRLEGRFTILGRQPWNVGPQSCWRHKSLSRPGKLETCKTWKWQWIWQLSKITRFVGENCCLLNVWGVTTECLVLVLFSLLLLFCLLLSINDWCKTAVGHFCNALCYTFILFLVVCNSYYTHSMHVVGKYTVARKKTSHFNFQHNFAICWDIFTVFEAFCTRIICAWHSVAHICKCLFTS